MSSTIAYSTATPSRENNRDSAARMMAAARRQREREAERRAAAARRAANPRLAMLDEHAQDCMGYVGWRPCELCEEWLKS